MVVKFEVSSETVRKLALNPPPRGPGIRVAVAKEDLVFGLTRMFQALGERGYPELQVVRSMDEAAKILKVNPAELRLCPVDLSCQSERVG